MEQAVIVDCLRTPMGRSKGGAFRHTRAEELSARLMAALLARNPALPAAALDDIIWGCVQQTLEQGFNIARNAALLAGLPSSVPAVTVNRLCGSSMQALHDASARIQAGLAQAIMIGGVEHMGHVPMNHGVDFHPGLATTVARAAAVMGLTAELLGRQHGISRTAQDAFALRSHQHAHAASVNGDFQREILAMNGHDSDGAPCRISHDEVIRADASAASLAQLKPAFDPRGSVTAGNASALSDGAAAMLVMAESRALQLGLKPRARIRAMAVTGCEPSIMGIGPVAASRRVLQQAGLNLADIDLLELNEAFAAQALPCLQQLGLLEVMDDKVNLNGGAIALGHPLGCSGARITTTLLHLLEARDQQFGLAAMCIGLGQGIATLVERC